MSLLILNGDRHQGWYPANTLSNVEQVDILPYHTMGIYKWEELGYTYTLRNVDPPDEETIRRARETLCK